MSTILKKYLGYILIVVGLLLVLVFRANHMHLMALPLSMLVVGVMVIWGGFVMSRRASFREEAIWEEARWRNLENLKRDGERIFVDFDDCEIKSFDYPEEINMDPASNDDTSEIRKLEAVSNTSGNVRQIEKIQCLIIYKNITENGVEAFRSEALPISKTDLTACLTRFKSTYIYVDRFNRSHYYFDLEFLNL